MAHLISLAGPDGPMGQWVNGSRGCTRPIVANLEPNTMSSSLLLLDKPDIQRKTNEKKTGVANDTERN